MDKAILCLIQCILVIYLVYKTYKRDIVQAVFFAGIFVYSIFTEINYAYFPEFINQYTYASESNWYAFYFFITMSFLALYVCSAYLDKIKGHYYIKVVDNYNRLFFIPTAIYNALLLLSIGIIIMNWNEMGYSNNVLRNFSSQVAFARSLNDWNVYYFLIMIAAARSTKMRKKKKWLWFSAGLSLIALVLFTFRNGDRSVILLCVSGWFVFYFYDKPLNFANIKKMLPIVAITLGYLFFVRLSRSEGRMSFERVKTFLQDDYAFPGMTLIAVMEDKFIHPLTVVKSFVSKASFVLPGQYLYWIVYEAEFPYYIQTALATGTNPGIGFHIFTEGYVFAGLFGFLYNGLAISTHLKLWKKLYTTNDKQTNIVMASIAIGIFMIGIRTETVYFIRNFVTFMIPAILMYMVTCDKSFRIVRK